jgi:hypothetical protein
MFLYNKKSIILKLFNSDLFYTFQHVLHLLTNKKPQFEMTINVSMNIKQIQNMFLLQKKVLDYMNNYAVLNPDEMKPNWNHKDRC